MDGVFQVVGQPLAVRRTLAGGVNGVIGALDQAGERLVVVVDVDSPRLAEVGQGAVEDAAVVGGLLDALVDGFAGFADRLREGGEVGVLAEPGEHLARGAGRGDPQGRPDADPLAVRRFEPRPGPGRSGARRSSQVGVEPRDCSAMSRACSATRSASRRRRSASSSARLAARFRTRRRRRSSQRGPVSSVARRRRGGGGRRAGRPRSGRRRRAGARRARRRPGAPGCRGRRAACGGRPRRRPGA